MKYEEINAMVAIQLLQYVVFTWSGMVSKAPLDSNEFRFDYLDPRWQVLLIFILLEPPISFMRIQFLVLLESFLNGTILEILTIIWHLSLSLFAGR
jgi:hypothetical protein